MWNLITGKSSEKSEASSPESRRRKDYEQRSAQKPSESIVSSKSARKPSRGDDRDGDRGFNPTSTSYSSTSRSSYPGTASASIASSYATASNGQTEDAVLPPGLVRNASLADHIPKLRSSRDDRDQDRARERKSERRRSSSRDRKRDRDSKRRERKGQRDKVDRGDGRDRGLTRSGSGYAEELSTSRAGEISAQASGSFNAQVGSSGFTQFPGQYDAGIPGFTSGPPPLHQSMSAHVQDQFPGQFPLESAAPYRPPLAASEGGPGLAAEYYGDAGESVAEQPGVRPYPLGPIIGAEPHLQPASQVAAPPPEPSSAGGVGAAASFYSGVDFPSTIPSQPSMTSELPRPGKQSKPTSSGSLSGAAALAGTAMLGYNSGTAGEAYYAQGSGSNGSAYYQQGSGRPPSSAEGMAAYSSTPAPINNGYHASSAPVLPTLGAAAAGAAAGYMMGSYSSVQQQPSVISGHSEYSSSATQRPPQFGDSAIGISTNSRPPRPAKISSQSSTLSFHAAGQSNPMAQKHRHRTGPLGTFVEFWTDPDGVAQYEEYTEYIGVCKNCFAPGSSPRDAPRKHHYRRRRSDERYGSSSRVDKESRWGSSDGENRRRSRKSWLAGGIAGYGLAEVGKTLFNQNRGADDTYNVRFSRGNASSTSVRRRSGSHSPSHGNRASYGVTGGSSASISRRRSRSRERIETGITSDGRIYKKDPHGSFLGGPAMKTYTPRRRSRSRSRSGDRHTGLATAALGVAVGSSVVSSKSRRRSRSPEKAFIRSKHRSRERSPSREKVSVMGGYFSSPSEKRQRSHRKKKKGFFSFGNSSSSSADTDLAFRAGLQVSRNRRQRSPRSKNGRSADAAFLGLSAAAAAIALRESQKGSKASRKADLVAVKETKGKKSVSSERHHRGRRTSASPTTEEDGWESASEEDDSSSVNSALAYGGPARRSQESLTSDSSGTAKWGWRWGSKKRSKRTVIADPTPSSFHVNAGTAAAALAGATAGVAVTSNTWQNDSRMSSSSNLPPLQQVYPVPTSDPSRFDVMRHDSITSSSQPLMTSRPAPVPLQQPQPFAPVSHTVYTTQPPYSHSYSAPSGPPVFSQTPYQSQSSIVGGPRDNSSGPRQINIPGSFPGGDIVADNTSWDGRAEFSHRRRETSPITRTAEPEVDSLPRPRRASTRDEPSAVRFDFSEEPKGKDLYDWRRRETGLDQRAEETNVQDAHEQRQFDHERRLSNGVSVRRTESTSEPERKMDHKGESHWYKRGDESKERKPGSRVVPVTTRTVGAAISGSTTEAAHFVAEIHQEEHREDDRRNRIMNGEGSANDQTKYSSEKGTGTPDTGEQRVRIPPRILSKSVKNPNHENYADYFVPTELLSQSSDDRRSTDVNGDNDVTSYQIPQIITVEPKGPGLSFLPTHTQTDEVDLDHMSLPWEVPRLNVIEPTPPHSIAGSTKGDASPVIKPEDAGIEETEEIHGSSTTSKVTWGKDETHTYQVVTPLENSEEFIGASRKLGNEKEDIHSSSEASPVDTTPIIVEIVPRHMPGDFGDDLEFAATLAAGLEDTGFDPAIVVDDATFRRRDSPPGSEPTGFYRRPFAETIIDLGLDSPGTEGAPPQRGFVEGELPPTPKYEQPPSASGGNADGSASKPSKKDRKRRKKVAQRGSEDDVLDASSSTSEPHGRGGVFDDPDRHSTEPQPMVSVPVNAFDYLDEVARVDSKGRDSKRDGGGLDSASSGSPVPTDLARSEYFDAPEAAVVVAKPSSISREFDHVTVDVPSTEQLVDEFQAPKRADKRKTKSKKSEPEGETPGFPAESPGSPALEKNDEFSSKRKSDRKSSRRDTERYDLADRESGSVISGPVFGEEGKSRSRKNRDNSDLYDSPPEDARSAPTSAPIEDEFDKPRKSKKKSKRGSSGYDDISTSVSSSATFEDKREPKSKSKKNKKGGILGLFGASKSSDKLSETAQAPDAIAEATSDAFEESRRKKKKSKERRSTRDGDDVSSQASDRLMEHVPESALAEEIAIEGTPNDFEDANGKRKKSKDRKISGAHDGEDGYGPAYQSTSNLSRLEGDDDGKSRRKEHKRRSQESDLMEESGRVTQALQAKDRDLPSTRSAPIIDAPDIVHAKGNSGDDESISFLEERRKSPPPTDIYIPADPLNLHAEKPVEKFPPSIVQPETEASRIAGADGSPSTPPLVEFPLEDLPPLPPSKPASPVPEVDDHRRRTSVVQTSESPQSPVINSSPTAVPLHFRRPPASPGPARSSPFASPATPSQSALVFVPPQRRSRPNSTEFKSSTEFRPLWLVERHGPRQEPAPVESYPSLPSSHTTSRSSSVHDPEEVDSHWSRDDALSESDGEDVGLRIDVSRSFERPDLLGSRQATPTAASFHLDAKDNVLAEAMQDSGQGEISTSHEDSAKEVIRVVSPISPKPLLHSVGDDFQERSVLTPIYLEGLEDLPPLPASRASSPLLENHGQEISSIPEEVIKMKELPPLPASRLASPLHEDQRRGISSISEDAEQLEELPPLPVSRPSSPLLEDQRRGISLISEEAELAEELPPLPASRPSSPLLKDQRGGISLMSEEAGLAEELPPLPASRPSSPLLKDQRGGISLMSEEAGLVEELPPLPASRPSSPLHKDQRGGISSILKEAEQLKELPPLPVSRPSSPLHEGQRKEISSILEEAEQPKELPPLLMSRSSSPLHRSRGLEALPVTENAEQTEELSPLLMSRSSSSLHQGQQRVIVPFSQETVQSEKLPPLPASRSSSLPREHENLSTPSLQDGAAMGAIVGLAAATVALASVNLDKAAASYSVPETEANPASVVEETTGFEKDEPQTSIAAQNLDKSEMLLSRKSKKKDSKSQKASSSRFKEDLPIHDEGVPQSTNDQDVGILVKNQKNDAEEEDGQDGADTWFIPSTSKKSKKDKKGKKKGRGGESSNTPVDSLASSFNEASSIEESRAVSPSGALNATESPARPGPDIITPSQIAEVAQDDWQVLVTGSKKSKGKKGKKKLAKSGQEEATGPDVTGRDTALEGPNETLGSQEPTADYEGENTNTHLLSAGGVGDLADVAGQSTNEVAPELVFDAKKSERLVTTNQEGEKTKEHLGLEDTLVLERSLSLQQRLDIAGQGLQSPSDKLDSVKDFSETANVVSTPRGDPEDVFFTPMGIPLSAQEAEAEAEYPFPTGKGKASKKAKKKRKTLPLGSYVEPSNPALEPQESSATRGMSEETQTEETGEFIGATTTTSNNTFEPAVEIAGGTMRSSDGGHYAKAASPTFQGPSAFSLAPEAIPLPTDDDLDLIVAPRTTSADRLSTPELVPLPRDRDLDLTETSQASPAGQLLAPELVPLLRDSDPDLTEVPQASPTEQLLTPRAVPLPTDENLGLVEARRATERLLTPEAVPLPTDKDLELIEAPPATERLLVPKAVPLPTDKDLELIEAPPATERLLTPEAVPLPTDKDLELIEAPPATERLLTPEAVPLPTDKDLELIEAPPATERLLTPEAVPPPTDKDLELIEAPPATERLLVPEAVPLPKDSGLDRSEAPRASPAGQLLAPKAVPLPSDEDLVLLETSPAAERFLTPELIPLPKDSDLDLTEALQASSTRQLLTPEAIPLPSDEKREFIEAAQAAEQSMTPEVVPLPRDSDLDLTEAPQESPAGQFLAPEAVPLPTDEDLDLIEAPSAAGRLLDPDFIPLPRDGDLDLEDLSLIAPSPGSVDKLLIPEAIPLPADDDPTLVEASSVNLADRSLTPEAVSLPTNLSLIAPPADSADKLSTPEAILPLSHEDPSLIEASSASLANHTLTPEATISLPLDKNLHLGETPPVSSVKKLSTFETIPLPKDDDSGLIEASSASLADQSLASEAVSLPRDKNFDLIESQSASSADRFFTPEAIPLPIDEDLDLIKAPAERSAERLVGPEAVPLPIGEDSDLAEASPASLADQSLIPEAVSLPIDKDLDLSEAPPTSSADRSLTAEAIPLPVDEDTDLIEAPSVNSAERFLIPDAVTLPTDENLGLVKVPPERSAERPVGSEAVPLPTGEDLDLVQAPSERSAEQLSGPEAVPLPIDEDLDLLEALPASPVLQPSNDTSRESGSASAYDSRLTTEKDRALTSSPPTPADGPDQLVLDQAPADTALEKEDVLDQLAVTQPMPVPGDTKHEPSSTLAQATRDIHPVHDSSSSADVTGGLDQSSIQEVAEDRFAVVSKKKGKKGKKGDQSLSITPDLGSTPTDSDFPVVATEPGSVSVNRAVDTRTPLESGEGDWDVPLKGKKGKKGKKEKSAVREPGYSSQEAVTSKDSSGPRTLPVMETQGADVAKDLTNPPELGESFSLPDPEEKWEPSQKKSKKGKKSKTQGQQSLPGDFAAAEGETEEPPAISESSLATTNTGKVVRDMLVDTGSTPYPQVLPQKTDAVNPLLSDPKPEQTILENPSHFDNHLTRDSTSKERPIEREETGVSSPIASVPENQLASEGTLAHINTAKEVQAVLADRGSPRPSVELSREDFPPPNTQALTEPSYEDNDTWGIPVKKKGKKGKKGRPLQGPESTTDENSIPPTPTVGPQSAPSNEDAMVEPAESFLLKKGKKEKKVKKALKKASSGFQDEGEAEVGVMPEVYEGPPKENTEDQSYFDRAIRPTEIQELPLSPQRQSELEIAPSVPLPMDEVGDKPMDVVAVQRLEESEEAWSRAVDITDPEMAPSNPSSGQQLPQSSPDAQPIADRGRELSMLGTPDPTAVEAAPMIEYIKDPAVEDDFTAFPTKMGKKAKRQQRKQLKQERANTDEGKSLPTSTQPKVPVNQESLGSSFPVDKTASGGRFSPELGAASREALRELELEDGVPYFGLTSAETGKDDGKQGEHHRTALASEGDQGAVHDDHPINEEVKHSFSTTPHESTLATIVEQPDYVDPVPLGHEPDSQCVDQDLLNQENSSQLFESTSKEVGRNIGATEIETGSSSVEQSGLFKPHIDDAPMREKTPLLATTDFSIPHPSSSSLPIGDPVSGSAPKSVAEENVPLTSNEDFSAFATSKKSKKGKKSKKKQEPVTWEDEAAPPAVVDSGEPTIKNLEAPPSPPTYGTPESGTSRNGTGYLPAEQRENRPSTEATSSTPTNNTAPEDQANVDEADDDLGYSTKAKKKGKKMKQRADLAQSTEDQPQLEKSGERDALTSQDNQSWREQRESDKLDIPREPQEPQHSDMHSLVQHADPVLMAKDGEHTSVPVIEPYQQTHSTSPDGLPSGVPQKSIPRADIDEVTIDRQIEHEHAAVNSDHPREVTATNEEQQDDLWDFPTTKKFKKSKKQSLRPDMDTQPQPQSVQPEPSVDQLHQYTSTISNDLPLSTGKPKEPMSVSPPQVTGHRGDGQLAGAAALATVNAGVAEALWHNNSEGKGDKSETQREDRQWKAHEDESVEFRSLHDKAFQPSEGSLQLDNATQHTVPVPLQLYHDSPPSLPQFSVEDEHRQNIARQPVPSFHYEDDAKRDSAVQISDSPVISERIPTYDVVRDSGYQGTESSPLIGTDPELIDTIGAERHPKIVERPSTQARDEQTETPEHLRSYKDTAVYDAENPLKISIEVDPAYEVAISRRQSRRSRGRVGSNSHDGSLEKNVAPRIDSRPVSAVKSLVQYFDVPSKPAPVDFTTKDRSSVLLQSSPSTREERMGQPNEHKNVHVSRGYIGHVDVSPAHNDSGEILSEPEMSPPMQTHDGASILAARASSLAALSGFTDAHHESPKSLFGGPVGINSDHPSTISPPRTPFSLESLGRRQLNTITEHSPEESPHPKNARAILDIGSPERGTKSARRSATPGEISQQRVRSPTVMGAKDKSLISTDDVLARLSWPPVDKDKHSVDLERSRSRNADRRPSSRHSNVSALVSDAMRQREIEHRSVSGASIRSGESINAIIRTPEQFRSASGLSNRSGTPPLRRVDTRSVSGDLRAASKRGEAKDLAKPAEGEAEPEAAPALSLAIPSSSSYDPVKDKGKSRAKDMADVYEGWGDVPNNGSPLSPTRPPSMRRRQSMQIMDLESRVDQLVSENRLLQDAKSRAERGLEDAHHDHGQKSSAFVGAIETRDTYLRQKDTELNELRQMLQSLQHEVTRLTEVNQSLETTRDVDADYAQRYSQLQAEHSETHEQWQQSRRELEDLRSQHSQLSTGMEGIVRHEVSIALEEKNAELARLREELEEAKEQVRTLQRQILASKPSDSFLVERDEDYFDTQCQQLCQRVQQWILRFSKLSDMKACRLMGDIDDEKILDRLDNAILDGSDVDNFLADRVKRRDVFMSMVMTMIWEYVFTRYLFGMDREQRQKLKALEKTLAEVGPMTAVHKWRATTLTLLSKREAFVAQRSQDSEAVVQEIYCTLSMFLPPPSHLENQIQESLRNVMKAAIDLSIEMRTQRAEYVMLPPLQPEYNTNGDLARKVYFNASLMNERSGDTSSNEELEAQRAVVRMVLFPLVVKKDDASGVGEQIVVCPAQVLVAKPGKDKKVVRVLSGDRMDIDRAGNRSVQSFAPSSMDMGMGNMI